MLLVLFFAGLLIGTLAEYLIHRAVGHFPGVEGSASPLLSRHGTLHHKVFTTRRGYYATRGETRREHIHLQPLALVIAVFLIVAVWGGLVGLSGLSEDDVLQPGAAMAAAGGLLLAMVLYLLLHWLHHVRPPDWLMNAPPYKQLRQWHHKHHAEPDSHFAVVLPLWDLLFFTHVGTPELKRPVTRQAEAKTRPRTRDGRRRKPTTIAQMMTDVVAQAEAQLDDDDQPKTRRGSRRKTSPKGSADDGAPATRPVTAAGTRPSGNGSGASTEDSGKKRTRPLGWLNTMDDPNEELDVSVTAVREDDD